VAVGYRPEVNSYFFFIICHVLVECFFVNPLRPLDLLVNRIIFSELVRGCLLDFCKICSCQSSCNLPLSFPGPWCAPRPSLPSEGMSFNIHLKKFSVVHSDIYYLFYLSLPSRLSFFHRLYLSGWEVSKVRMRGLTTLGVDWVSEEPPTLLNPRYIWYYTCI
jgi:hypothetical protein